MNRHQHIEPHEGSWYKANIFPEPFAVINSDKTGYIQIQYMDGELDRIDYDCWDELHPAEIPEPEDAAAPYGLEHEDADILQLLEELENHDDLESHLRHIDDEESEWN